MPGFSLGLGLGGSAIRKSSGGSAAAANWIPDSNDFESDFWNGTTTDLNFLTWNDPWGNSGGATLVVADSTPTANVVLRTDPFVLGGAGLYCLSAHVLKSIQGNDGTCLLQLDNDTKSLSFQLAWTYSGDVATYYNSTGADAYGIDTVGTDPTWYRVYAYLDTTADSWAGDSVEVVVRPYGSDAVANHGIGLYGVQIDAGATPDTYVETP